MDHPTPTPPPPPAEPPPENPPEAAVPETHHYSAENNDPAMHKFRALMMKLTIASSPNKSLTPEQQLIFEEKLLQCFPYLKSPDHPTYAWMISTAIKQLNEEGGSSEEAISESIMNNNSDLPWAHATILRHHLGKLCEKGDIVRTKDGLYMLNESVTKTEHISSPSNPREWFDASNSPGFSISSGSLYSDSGSDSPKRKRRRRRRKLKKTGKKRLGRPPKSSGRQKNVHLKRKREVRGRPPKKGKRKEKITSDEEMEEEDLNPLEETVQVNAITDVIEKMNVDGGADQIGEQHEMQEKTKTSSPMNDTVEARDLYEEPRNGVVQAQNQQKEMEMEIDAEIEEMGLQDLKVEERIVVVEEQNQLKQNDVIEEEHQGNQQEVQLEQNKLKENYPLNVENQGQMAMEELQDCDVVEQIHGNQAQEELKELHQSREMEKEDKQEGTKEKKTDLVCEKDLLLQEMEVQELLLQERTDIDETQDQLMQQDVMEQEYLLQLMETKDQAEKTSLVNETQPQDSVDEGKKEQQMNNEHIERKLRRQEIVLGLKSEADIARDKKTKEIKVFYNTDEPEEGMCLRSRKMVKARKRQKEIKTVIANEVSEHEETVEVKQIDQQGQDTLACEEDIHVNAELITVADPDRVCSSEEVEVMSSEEEQEVQFPEDTKKEQQKNRQLQQPRFPKTKPGCQEHKVLQGQLSLQATRRVTRQMAAATASRSSSLLDDPAHQQRKKLSKGQVQEVSCTPRRSARLSTGQ